MTDEQAALSQEATTVVLPGPSWKNLHAVCIDSAGETASIALVSAGVVVAEETWRTGMVRARILAPTLRQLAARSGFALDETQIVCVCTGPGSFNGIRVGMATAIGLAVGLGVPVYGCGALDLLAFPHADRAPAQRALLPAGKGMFYSALFGSRGGRWRRAAPYTVAPLADLVAESPAKCLWCGPLDQAMGDELTALLGGGKRVIAGAHNVRRASYLLTLALAAAEAGAPGTTECLTPLYLRRPAITTPRTAVPGGR
ncbi:MAG: tRNA (adenosine(37)-N6)-threonylcarbamoyltransferase complex dimerization subunit type 1 TsaB [Chloroflexota bacterium]